MTCGGQGLTGEGRHVDDSDSVFLAGFKVQDGFIVDTRTGGQFRLGVHVLAVLGDVDEGRFWDTKALACCFPFAWDDLLGTGSAPVGFDYRKDQV
jgi:hypothetical protein